MCWVTLEEKISVALRTLKELAQGQGIPIMVALQLSREPERRLDKRPRLQDFLASYAIDRFVDRVILLYRYGYYFIHGGNNGELILAKNQDGEKGTAYVKFNEKKLRFEDSHIIRS